MERQFVLWSDDIERLLHDIRINSALMSTEHKNKFFYYKKVSARFRIPTIILASVASVSSVGLQSYTSQQHISAITCLISLVVGVINSVELYLRLQDNLENELDKSKQYYQLSTDIFKITSLNSENRVGEPNKILDEFYDRYIDLFSQSNLMRSTFKDKLIIIPKGKSGFPFAKTPKSSISSSSSSSSGSRENPLGGEEAFESNL
jgi:hypothetical protein